MLCLELFLLSGDEVMLETGGVLCFGCGRAFWVWHRFACREIAGLG